MYRNVYKYVFDLVLRKSLNKLLTSYNHVGEVVL